MKIGRYTDDEILEFMTEGEGRGFLGRSMFDAIMEEIERLNNNIDKAREYIEKVETLAMVDKVNIFSMSTLKMILDKGKE